MYITTNTYSVHVICSCGHSLVSYYPAKGAVANCCRFLDSQNKSIIVMPAIWKYTTSLLLLSIMTAYSECGSCEGECNIIVNDIISCEKLHCIKLY